MAHDSARTTMITGVGRGLGTELARQFAPVRRRRNRERIAVVMMHPGWVQTDMGGPAAQLTVLESAGAMTATIGALSLPDSGRFIRWDDTDHPW